SAHAQAPPFHFNTWPASGHEPIATVVAVVPVATSGAVAETPVTAPALPTHLPVASITGVPFTDTLEALTLPPAMLVAVPARNAYGTAPRRCRGESGLPFTASSR